MLYWLLYLTCFNMHGATNNNICLLSVCKKYAKVRTFREILLA